MQNNDITLGKAKPLPIDRGETVALSRSELDSIINRAVSEAAAKFESLFVRTMGEATGKGDKWLNTAAAAAVLGKRPDQLREMVKDGRLRVGREVRDDRPKCATNPVYVFDILKCEKRLLTPPEKRGK